MTTRSYKWRAANRSCSSLGDMDRPSSSSCDVILRRRTKPGQYANSAWGLIMYL